MGKGKVFVLTFSVFTLVLFGLFLHLMANVNPRPIPTNSNSTFLLVQRRAPIKIGTNTAAPIVVSCSRSTTPPQIEIVCEPQKESTRSMNFRNAANDTEETTLPTMRVFPKNFELLNFTSSTPTLSAANISLGANDTTLASESEVKGFERRSLGDRNRKVVEEESLLLQIMDDKGSPRIEIKLPGNAEISKKNLRIISRQQGGKHQKHRVIKLMPDNSFVFQNEDTFTNNCTEIVNTTHTILNTTVFPITPDENRISTAVSKNDTMNYEIETEEQYVTEIENNMNNVSAINNTESLIKRDLESVSEPISKVTDKANNSKQTYIVRPRDEHFTGSPNITISTTNVTDIPKDLKINKRVLHVYPNKVTNSYQKVTEINVVESVFDKSLVADEVVSTIYPTNPGQIQYTAFNETTTQHPNVNVHPYMPVQFFVPHSVDLRAAKDHKDETSTLIQKLIVTNQP